MGIENKIILLENYFSKVKDLFLKYKDDIDLTETIINDNLKVKVIYNENDKLEFIVTHNNQSYTNFADKNSQNHIDNLPNDINEIIVNNILNIAKIKYIEWLKLDNENKIFNALDSLYQFNIYNKIFKSYNEDVEWCSTTLNNCEDLKIIIKLKENEYIVVIDFNNNKFILMNDIDKLKECLPTEVYDELAFNLDKKIQNLYKMIYLNYFI